MARSGSAYRDRKLPEAWSSRRKRHRALFALALVVNVIALVIAIFSPVPDSLAVSMSRWSLVTLFLSLAVLAYMSRVTPQNRSMGNPRALLPKGAQSNATTIPVRRDFVVLTYVLYLSGAIFFAVFPLAVEPNPTVVTHPRSNWVIFVAPVMPLFSLYFLSYLVSPLIRKRKRMGLGLAADGIYHWTWFGCCFFRWEWITRMRPVGKFGYVIKLVPGDEPSDREPNDEENFASRIGSYRRTLGIRVVAGGLDCHPALAYYALQYYSRHPENREELGTDSAIKRMRQFDFGDVLHELLTYGDVRENLNLPPDSEESGPSLI